MICVHDIIDVLNAYFKEKNVINEQNGTIFTSY